MMWRATRAILIKEVQSEFRTQSELWVALLFGVVTVFALSAASFNVKLNGSLAAGLLWVALLFGATVSLPRRFIAEEEAKTAELLRLTAHPHAVYWGKTLFSVVESLAFSGVVCALFFLLTSMPLTSPALFALGIVGTAVCLAGVLSLCSAIGSRAANRAGLASAIALPLLAPIIFLGISCLRVAMGDGLIDGGWRSGVGLLGYGLSLIHI